jgi:uncharacterized membrane protein YciS (DUF1049 family)
MGWVTVRVALAHLLPGLISTVIVFVVWFNYLTHELNLDATLVISIYLFIGLIAGIILDSVRHRFDKHYIAYFNSSWFRYWIDNGLSRVTKTWKVHQPLKVLYEYYDMKEREAVRLWLDLRLDKAGKLAEKIRDNPVLEKEFYRTTITIGDKWALLHVIDKDAAEFFLNEYFSYYEFSFNCLVASVFMAFAIIGYLLAGHMDKHIALSLLVLTLLLMLVLDSSASFWLLACKRYTRKYILYSILREEGDGIA